jgi:hypothetical protein
MPGMTLCVDKIQTWGLNRLGQAAFNTIFWIKLNVLGHICFIMHLQNRMFTGQINFKCCCVVFKMRMTLVPFLIICDYKKHSTQWIIWVFFLILGFSLHIQVPVVFPNILSYLQRKVIILFSHSIWCPRLHLVQLRVLENVGDAVSASLWRIHFAEYMVSRTGASTV